MALRMAMICGMNCLVHASTLAKRPQIPLQNPSLFKELYAPKKCVCVLAWASILKTRSCRLCQRSNYMCWRWEHANQQHELGSQQNKPKQKHNGTRIRDGSHAKPTTTQPHKNSTRIYAMASFSQQVTATFEKPCEFMHTTPFQKHAEKKLSEQLFIFKFDPPFSDIKR